MNDIELEQFEKEFDERYGTSGVGYGKYQVWLKGFINQLLKKREVGVECRYKDLQPIETAPKDGIAILGLYPDGVLTDIYWSERPVCMLGSVNGGYPEGWATAGRDTDYNLPMDTPLMWKEI